MRRLVPSVCLLLVMLLLWSYVFAAYDYSVTIRVTNNSSTDYSSGIPVLISINNSQLYSLGYIAVDGLDTDLQEGSTSRDPMIHAINVGVVFPSLSPYQTRTISYRLGESPARTDFPLVVGYGGSVAITDAAALEPSDNFTIEVNGYIDTSQTSANITSKSKAVRVYVSGTNNVTASIPSLWTNSAGALDFYGTVWMGQTFTPGESFTIDTVNLKMYRVGSPGTITVGIRATSGGDPTGADLTAGTTDGNTLTTGTGGEWRTIDLTNYALSADTMYAIVVRAAAGNSSNKGLWRLDTTGGFSGGEATQSGDGGSSWSTIAGDDFTFDIPGGTAASVTATGVSSGSHDVVVSLNGTALRMVVDGSEEDSFTWNGSVVGNGYNWALFEGQSVPSVDVFRYWVDGTLVAWYQPVTMLSGTVLTDRKGGDQNGAITFGNNPVGINITIGMMSSSVSSVQSVAGNTTVPELLLDVDDIEFIPVPTEPELASLFMYPAFSATATSMGMSTQTFYIMVIELAGVAFGLAALLAVKSGWGFIAGFGFVNVAALGTPLSPVFFAVALGFIGILGLFVFRRVSA